MSREAWLDEIAGERMQLDAEFADRLADSPFSSQQWGLVMTAVEFRIENPEDPDAAELVADTSKLTHVADELRAVDRQAPGGDDGGGFVDRVADALGLGDDALPAEERDAAERLSAEYADELQQRLEERGRWERVCSLAAES